MLKNIRTYTKISSLVKEMLIYFKIHDAAKDIQDRFKKNWFIYLILSFLILFNFSAIHSIFSESLLLFLLLITTILCYTSLIFNHEKIVQLKNQVVEFLLNFISCTLFPLIIFISLSLIQPVLIEKNFSSLYTAIFLIIFICIIFGLYYWGVCWIGRTDLNEWIEQSKQDILTKENKYKRFKKLRIKALKPFIHIAFIAIMIILVFASYQGLKKSEQQQEILKICSFNETNPKNIICSEADYSITKITPIPKQN